MPEESVKNRITSACVPNDRNTDPSQILPSQRGLKRASLNISKLTTQLDKLRILLANNDVDIVSIKRPNSKEIPVIMKVTSLDTNNSP